MKKAIFLIVFLGSLSVFGQNCPEYADLMKEGNNFFKAKLYRKALNNFNAAKLCMPSMTAEVDKRINQLFEAIENDRDEAIKQKKEADKASFEAKQERDKAREQRERTMKILQMMQYSNMATENLIKNANNGYLYVLNQFTKDKEYKERIPYLFSEAETYQEVGEFDKAKPILQYITSVYPYNIRAWNSLSYQAYATGDLDSCIYYADRALKLDTLNEIPNLNKCICLADKGDYTKAKEQVEFFLGNFRYNNNTYFYQTNLNEDIYNLLKINKIILSKEYLKTILSILIDGIEFYKGNFGILDKYQKKIVIEDKNIPVILYSLNHSYLHYKHRPDDYSAYLFQGLLWEKIGFDEFALKNIKEFNQIHLKKKDKRYERYNQWVKGKIAQLEKNSLDKPVTKTNFDFYINLLASKKAFEEEKYDSAIDMINSMKHIDSLNIEQYILKLRSYYYKEDYDKVYKEVDKVLSLDSTVAIAYFYRFLSKAEQNKLDDSAYNDLIISTQLDFGNTLAFKIKSQIHENGKDYESALNSLFRAILSCHPNEIEELRTKFFALEKLRDEKKKNEK